MKENYIGEKLENVLENIFLDERKFILCSLVNQKTHLNYVSIVLAIKNLVDIK